MNTAEESKIFLASKSPLKERFVKLDWDNIKTGYSLDRKIRLAYCPYCGARSAAFLDAFCVPHHNKFKAWVWCASCGADGSSAEADTEIRAVELAADKWNRRYKRKTLSQEAEALAATLFDTQKEVADLKKMLTEVSTIIANNPTDAELLLDWRSKVLKLIDG